MRRWGERAAAELLDLREPQLVPGARAQVLKLAAGNPLALIELPEALRRTDALGDLPVRGPVSWTTHLERAFAGQTATLPAETQTVLLVAAADERLSHQEALAAASIIAGHELSVGAFAPAEAIGLVRVGADASLDFRHPLVDRRCTRRLALPSSAELTRR